MNWFMRRLEAVIFDMDGVLIDTEPIHYMIERKIFDQLELKVPENVHKTYLGVAGDFMYTDLKKRYGLSQTLKKLLEQDDLFRCEYFRQSDAIHINDGIPELLREIKMTGLKLAVATSSSPELAKILLNRCELFSFFDTVVSTAEAGKSKPAPDVYLLAAQRIGVLPDTCVVFEDSPNGLSAAKSAGMRCIALKTNSVEERELSGVDFLIRTFKSMTLDRLLSIYAVNHPSK